MAMVVEHFFHEPTWTLSYLVYDSIERVGVVIDSVRDFDWKSGRTAFDACERIAAKIDAERLEIPFVLDTHAHADHLSGLPFFKERYGARTCIGRGVTGVQRTFRELFNLGDDFAVDGGQFDRLLDDGDELPFGSLQIRVLATPGHTPACVTYQIGDALFVGDTLFAPDSGTARCDFPAGSAETLFDSITRLYELPPKTRVFLCHDYQPEGRVLQVESSIGEQRRSNVALNGETTREQFTAARKKRDASLEVPNLILPSIQVNIRAGELPPPDDNGVSYLRFPLNSL